MSGEVLGYYSRRYIVEVGYDGGWLVGLRTTEWEFHRGFDSLTDATAYAGRISEDHAHVRVVDRGESHDG